MTFPISSGRPTMRRLATTTAAVALALANSLTPAFAAIDNTANASGTSGGNPVTTTVPGTASVPVVAPSQVLTATKTGVINSNVVGDADVEAGDTITYTINVKNDGNVTMTGVTPQDDGLTFNGAAASGTWGAFSPASVDLAPGADQDFVVTYTLSAADIANAALAANGVDNTASATGTGPGGATTSNAATEELDIPADPELTIAKAAVLTKAPANNNPLNAAVAEAGDTITYTYTVTNTGNAAIDDVSIDDSHEGAPLAGGLIIGETETTAATLGDSDDTTSGPNSGVWDKLGAGGVITFTYVHTVTQTEVDNQ